MFIFVARNRIRPGQQEDERLRAPRWAEFIEQHEPRLIAFHEFLTEDGAEVEYVQVHPDAQSFEHHLRVIAGAAGSYQSTLQGTTSIRIYGDPTPEIMANLRRSAGSGVPIVVLPTHLAGFTRSAAADG